MRIQIIGLTGVGKTTLCNYLSKKYNFKKYEIDDLIYKKKFTKKNEKKEIEEKLEKIFKEEKFVLDGTYLNFDKKNYENFKLIVLIEISFLKNFFRIMKRFFSKEYNKKNFLKNIILFFKSKFKKSISKEILLHNEFVKKNTKVFILKNKKDLVLLEKLIKEEI